MTSAKKTFLKMKINFLASKPETQYVYKPEIDQV
jgi:hypothetical protein